MNEQKVELEIPVLLPQIEDARDECVRRLEDELQNRRGVLHTHVLFNGQPARLCIHYDPDLISLAAVRRMARDAGAELTDRYPHETIRFTGLEAADVAQSLTEKLAALPAALRYWVSGLKAPFCSFFLAWPTQVNITPWTGRATPSMPLGN